MLDKEVIRQELERIYKQNGTLEAKAVVEEASNPHNPLHEGFTWDDALAGHLWRIEEAYSMIRSVTIVVEKEDRIYRIPFFVEDVKKETHTQGYCITTEIKGKNAARLTVLQHLKVAQTYIRKVINIATILGQEKILMDFEKELDTLIDGLKKDMK